MQLESDRSDMDFRDLVQCAMIPLVEPILGCSVTLGGENTLGYGVYIGDNGVTGIVVGTQNFLVTGIRVAGFLIAGDVVCDMDGAGGVMSVLGIKLVNSSQRL